MRDHLPEDYLVYYDIRVQLDLCIAYHGESRLMAELGEIIDRCERLLKHGREVGT